MIGDPLDNTVTYGFSMTFETMEVQHILIGAHVLGSCLGEA